MPNQSTTQVIITQKRNAKKVKNALETNEVLDKSFRMASIDADSFSQFVPIGQPLHIDTLLRNFSEFICIPVQKEFFHELSTWEVTGTGSISLDSCLHSIIMDLIIGHAKQSCPYSSSVMGDANRRVKLSSTSNSSFDLVKNILVEAILEFPRASRTAESSKHAVNEEVGNLSDATAPPKLEVMGNDRTLVIPFRALNLAMDQSFQNLVESIAGAGKASRMDDFMTCLWKKLALAFRSHRVVRRGEISPNSKVRESGHSILWIEPSIELGLLSADSGPGSRGWITATEQGIKQSFDLTKVMFSRGNVSEKIRFGKIVNAGDLVLDMYAGIGYYSLPALIHGKARHVYSCEWNPHAASFLRYNLEQNGVSDRATVLDGDSRIRLAEEGVLNLDFDRVSLGLLPSSEGGWKTALSALNREKGGWLHIHANVPSHERDKWALWMCRKLSTIYLEIYPDDSRSRAWIVCHNVEKVKSYSPKVDHFVADVFVGPRLPEWMRLDLDEGQGRVGICSNKGFLESGVVVEPPSCALGNGVLDQEWMM